MFIAARSYSFAGLRVLLSQSLVLRLLFLALVFGQAPGLAAAGGIVLVQHASKDAGITTSSSLAFGSANTAGHWIAVCIRAGNSSSQVFTVKDSIGNAYKKAAQVGFTASAATLAIYYAENIKGGANAVTVSDTLSAPFRFAILEYSGIATSSSLDATAVATAVSTLPNSGNLTTTASGDLLLAAIGSTNPATFTAGSGYTIEDDVPAEPSTKLITEDQLQAGPRVASAGASLAASDSWGAVVAAFKPGGGVAGVAASITATAGTPQSATVGTAFATQLQATVKDSFNNPVSGVTVTFAAPGSGASGTFTGGVNTATTNASGIATTVFTANNSAGAYVVTASVSSVSSPANFSLTNLASAAASIVATAGTPQSAAVSTVFATQLQATVKDSFNNPVGGVTVTFSAPASGASGSFAGGVNAATTNASGTATAAVFTANAAAGGPYSITASVSGIATPANFSLTNLAGPAASIAATAGTPQSATINTAFATQLQTTVNDSFNNPVSGVTVTFTAPTSGASGTIAGGVKTATTNASGVATAAIFTANGTAGSYTVTASVSGVATPVNFSLTNLAGVASSITATAGTPQSASINTAFATQLQANVKDSGNNPVSGVTVTFTVPPSGASGTFAGGVNTATTNASGIAIAPIFTANGTAGGPYTVTASVSGVATPASFSLTNLGNPPASIAVTTGTPQSATINTAFPIQLQATVTDSGNNSVSGVIVTFTEPTNRASGTFASGVNTAITNASGVATAAIFTANGTAGSYTVTASVSGVATPANFSLTNLVGAPSSITPTAGTPQSATVNTAFTSQLQATVKDAGNNPVSGVTVTFTAPTSGASSSFAGGVNTATTNPLGVATSAVLTANSTAGAYPVTASVSGVSTPASFSLTNQAGTAASVAATAGTPQSANVNAAFPTQLQATVTDSFNNPVSGVTVTFTAPASGASGTFAGGLNTATTNASGVAMAAVFTANSVAGGPYNVTASVSGVATPANFSLTNLGSPPASIAASVGTPQTGIVNTAFATQLQATVQDSLNNPVSGVTVTFATVANTVPAAMLCTFETATDGTQVTTAIMQASCPGYGATPGGTWSFGGGTASALKISTSAQQARPAATNVGGTIYTDASGTRGITYNASISTGYWAYKWTASSDSAAWGYCGKIPVPTTDSGYYSMFGIQHPGSSGFDFANIMIHAGKIYIETNSNPNGADDIGGFFSYTANTPYCFALQYNRGGTHLLNIFDASGNLLSAQGKMAASGGGQASQLTLGRVGDVGTPSVLFTYDGAIFDPTGAAFPFTSSGASGTFAGGVNTATTNAQGIATAPIFTANSIVGGPYNVTASVVGVASPANFSLTNLVGPPATVTATAGTPQTAIINTAFATQLQATVQDSLNNPVSGATITFTAPSSGASGTFAGGVNTATTNAQGIATAPIFTANSTVGGPYNLTASVAGVATPANFSLTNIAQAPSNIALIQHANLDAGTTTTGSLPFRSSNTAGNWIAVCIRAGNSSSQVFMVKDSNGNTYRQAVQSGQTASQNTLGIFYAENIKGGANTITVSDTVAGILRFAIFEYSGIATSNSLDVTAAAQGNSTLPNSGTVSTTASGDLLLGTVITFNPGSFTPGSGYTIEERIPAEPNTKLIAEDQIQLASGTASASTSLAGTDNWAVGLAAFKGATAGGGGTNPSITSLSQTVGAVGTPITITGTNFGSPQGTSAVTFNGTLATPASWSATSIVVPVPTAATTGNVVVTVGGVASNTVAFTVTIPPPIITGLNPSSAVAGGGNLILSVFGMNFVPASIVRWNGTARTTAFISSTQLQATVTSTDIAAIGTAKVTVANPISGGGVSPASTFMVGATGGSNFAVITVNQTAQDIVYDPINQVIYVSVPGTASSNPNTISVLDPKTGTITSSQPAGNNPNVLAISDDSQFLYAGIDGAASVQRFILPGLANDISYALGTNATYGPYFALDLQVAPGAPHTTAVTLGNTGVSPKAQGGIAVFDDAIARPTNTAGGGNVYDSLQWGANGSTLFASANDELSGFELYSLSVNASGVALSQSFPSPSGTASRRIHFDAATQLVYADEGHVISPTTGLPTGSFNTSGAMVVDPALNTAFFASVGASVITIESFDLTHFTPIGSIDISVPFGTPLRLVRWGQNGLAFIDQGFNGSNQIILVGGNFVSPAPAFSATPPPIPTPPPVPAANAPTIASLNPSSAIAGSGALILTVIGTQFDPAANVQFNGSALATTFVSSTQLKTTIPTSNVANPGAASVTVANPIPTGGISAPTTFFVGATGGTSSAGTGFAVEILNQASKDILFDPADQLIYLSVPNSVSNGNTIAVLDPATTTIVGEQYAGSNPNVIAISDDGQFLYAGIDGSCYVQRFRLPALTKDIQYSLVASSFPAPQFALDLQVAPGAPHTTAVTAGVFTSTPAAQGGITIFDDATARPTTAKGFGPGGGGSVLYDTLQWGADATALFGANGEGSGFDFYTLSVNSSGVVLANDYPNTFSSFTNRIHFDNGTRLIYADDGHVVDPTTGLSVGNFGAAGAMVPDSTLNRVFFVTSASGETATIQVFDQTHFAPISSITISNVSGKPLRLIRWGQNGLAFNTDAGQIVLVGGNFVR